MLTLELTLFAFTFWLGAYLYGRNRDDLRLNFAAWGLICYSLALAGNTLVHHAPHPTLTAWVVRLTWPLFFLPPLFWLGVIVLLLPDAAPGREWLERVITNWTVPAAVLIYLVSTNTFWLFQGSQPGRAYLPFAVVLSALLLLALGLMVYALRTQPEPERKRPYVLTFLATLFFVLGMSSLLFLVGFSVPRTLILLGLGGDFIALGAAVAWLDAFNEGESLRPDFARSLAASTFVSLLFGGQVALIMVISTGVTFAMLTLLIFVLIAAVVLEVFSDDWQAALDQIIFARFPQLRETRANLRAAASAAPRLNTALEVGQMDAAEFTRLTRRALSHLGNLPKLAASPLTQLPLVESRLEERGASAETLERAMELRDLLTESIEKLRPNGRDFATTDEWRYYNALYYPYVLGLKPYSRRITHVDLDDSAQEALEWFQQQVPERTLYNWQNRAAELIAQDLRERELT